MVDEVTLKPLYKGWNLHHMDQRPEHYTNVDNECRFRALNKQTHEFIHWLYRYYVKDPFILDRIEETLEYMKKYSED